MHLTRDYFENELGYSTKDVDKIASHDMHATKGGEVVKVEVKGTTIDGAEVVLTRKELNRHRRSIRITRWRLFDTSVSTAAVTNQLPPAENWF
jgi:hypothetical protein